MSGEKLRLEVVFAAVDKFLRPVNGITKGASEAAKALRDTNARMKELNRTVEQIDAFKKAEKDAAITANAFKGTRDKIAALREEIDKTGVPTKAMAAELAGLSRKSDELRSKHETLLNTQQRLFGKLKEGGVDTARLADEQRRLASAAAEATNASRRHAEALEVENQKMKRLRAAQADLEKQKQLAGKIAAGGAAIAAGGAAMSLPVAKATKDFASFETAMLGVARQVDGARDDNGKLTATYYEIGDAVKAMSERLPLSANEIAKILEGGARMGIQGKQNLLAYTETTAIMANAFDLPVDQVGEDIGKISQLYKVPIKDIKALGDTLNWLDDNAQSKGGDIIDVMQRIAGDATTAGMNFKEAAALGSTFLSLGAAPEVAASASKAMIRELSIATMQSKRFREGARMLNLDLKALQKSASTDATGTILKVMDAIKALPKEKQIEAATRLFGKEFGDDAAKLASNLDEYRRQLKLVNEERAKGSMNRERDARNDTLDARLSMAKNAMSNLSSDLGAHLKEPMVQTLETTMKVVNAMREWGKENPALAGGIMNAIKYLAIMLTVVGGLGVAAGGILVPLAMLKFSLTALGIGGGTATLALGGIGAKAWAIISPIGKLTAAFGAGYTAGTLLATGIDLALSKVLGYETTLGGAIFDLVQRVKGMGGDLLNWFTSLPGRMMDAGSAMLDGFIRGIDARWGDVKARITGLGDSSISWLKEKLGIRSPSRVFAELGGFTMEGFEQGLRGGEGAPLKAVGDMARKLAGLGAGVAISGAAMAGGIALDTRPPLGAAPAAAVSGGGNTYQIHIHSAPGQDERAIAALVGREIERIERAKASRARGRLRDTE